MSLALKFQATEKSVNGRLVERTDETKTALTAIVGRVHWFALGSPGIAKSLLVRTLVKHIDGMADFEYFERLLTRFSTPEEVFGPPSLKSLEQDLYRRNVHGMLPTGLLAFIDEVFKANSSILNSLLSVMNERIYYNDVPINVPLWSLFTASNELPQGEELEAMYDRLHFRHIVKPISQSGGGFIQMLKLQELGPIVPTLTKADVEQAQAEASAVTVTEEVLDAFKTLRSSLHRDGIEPTDRRFAECLKIVKATAWMNERTDTDINDMRLLRHALWTRPDERVTVDTHVLQLASPLDAEAMSLRTELQQLAAELDVVLKDSDNVQQRNRKAIDLHGKLDRATAELESLKERAVQNGRKSEVVEEVSTTLTGLLDRLLKEVFNIDPTKVGK